MRKVKVTAQQRRNAESALYDMWPSIPERNVSLLRWLSVGEVGKADCNTIACFGGWCAVWPPFIAQGVYVRQDGAPFVIEPETGFRLYGVDVSRYLFGDQGLFYGVLIREHSMSMKDIITQRLQNLILISEVVDG